MAEGCLPFSLAHGVRLKADVKEGGQVRWKDVECDPDDLAVRSPARDGSSPQAAQRCCLERHPADDMDKRIKNPGDLIPELADFRTRHIGPFRFRLLYSRVSRTRAKRVIRFIEGFGINAELSPLLLVQHLSHFAHSSNSDDRIVVPCNTFVVPLCASVQILYRSQFKAKR